MALEASSSKSDSSRAATQILAPIAGLLAAVILIVAALVQVATEGADLLESGRARMRLENALVERAATISGGAVRGRLAELTEVFQAVDYHPSELRAMIVARGLGQPSLTLDARRSDVENENEAALRKSGIVQRLVDAARLKAVAARTTFRLADFSNSEKLAEDAARRASAYALLLEPSGNLTLLTAAFVRVEGPVIGPPLDFPVLATRTLEHGDLVALAIEHALPRIALRTGEPRAGEDTMPILDRHGAQIAALYWTPDRPGETIRDHARPTLLISLVVITLLCGLVFEHVRHVAVNLAQREAAARSSALHDMLTSLPNRVYFERRLDQELTRLSRTNEGLALMFIDLDRFKEVNDTHGHSGGDQLIRQTAQRLSNTLRGADTAARFGGDEFAVIQVGLKSIRDAESLARRLLEELRQPFLINGSAVQIGASIGIVMSPAHGRNREDLMRLADLALYRAKNEGKNRFAFFNEGMDQELKVREAVEHDLRVAIELDLLDVYYQPQYAANGRSIRGVEALVRWRHPRFGMIPPSDFIWIAEERGLIHALGRYVMRRAFLDAARWPGLRVAVNVSPIQFRNSGFVADVARLIAETGIAPDRIELELTEGVVMENADTAEQTLIALKALGVQLALDDFGNGYSSLIYLRRFVFDKIKIDRSFLESLEPTGESAMIVQSIIHLGRALGLTVCAEGVETEEQRILLMAAGCHELQGFLFSRAVLPDVIDNLLAELPQPSEKAA